MSKRRQKAETTRPATKAQNPLLPPEAQGRAYRISGFHCQPEIQLFDAKGKEERRFLAPVRISVYEASYGTPLPQILESEGLKMESEKK